jgi:hypothetical protein
MTATGEEAQIQTIVAEVLSRLASRLGADGSRGKLIMVFTGATVGLAEAGHQAGSLILDGFHVQIAFSEAGERLVGPWVRRHLACFPQVSEVSSANWLSELREARLVVVPLLSVNTLSKLCLLLADNLALNLILQALFMGKPVFVARDGTDPANPGRRKLGFHRGRAKLTQAVLERLMTLEAYGCILTNIQRMRTAVTAFLSGQGVQAAEESRTGFSKSRLVIDHSGKVLTAADIAQASRVGADFRISTSCLVTPLAREWALQHQVGLNREAG